MTVFGRVPAGQALTRSGAQPGDLLCVGGELGNAAGALPLVLGQRSAERSIAEPLLAPLLVAATAAWPWAWLCGARPRRRWIFPTACSPIAGISPRLRP